jgi:hypothetical protein
MISKKSRSHACSAGRCAMTRTISDKLAEIGRRSPKEFHALEVMVGFVLDRLGPEDDSTKPYVWKCDALGLVTAR